MAVKRNYAVDMQSAQTNLRGRQEAGEVILTTHQQDFIVGMSTVSGCVDRVFSNPLYSPFQSFSNKILGAAQCNSSPTLADAGSEGK